MDPPQLDRLALLQQFDKLRESGQLLWTPSTIVVELVDKTFPFEFRVTPAQKTKPSFPEDDESSGTETPDPQPNGNTTHSDIDNNLPEWHIAHVNGTHRLIFNKYCIYRPQYILLTADPAKQQTSLLNKSDFSAAWTALQALDGPHYLIFNSAKQAGGSRMHKHMQIFEQDRELLLPDRLLRDAEAGGAGEAAHPQDRITVPYKYNLSRLHLDHDCAPSTAASTIQPLYAQHIHQCAAALGLDLELESPSANAAPRIIPHNVILTQRWIMTIPRRKAGLGAATANAAGFLGLVWVPEEAVIGVWEGLGPAGVLGRLGVAREG